jgi:sugar/nucleoside kinase (ribokinase family)
MKPAAITNELSAFVRKSLKTDPEAKVGVCTIRQKGDGDRAVAFALVNHVTPGDLIDMVDGLLRGARDMIANGRHPDCDNCRQNIIRIEAARSALGVEHVERTS